MESSRYLALLTLQPEVVGARLILLLIEKQRLVTLPTPSGLLHASVLLLSTSQGLPQRIHHLLQTILYVKRM